MPLRTRVCAIIGIMHLVALQIGLPQERASTIHDGQDVLWTSAIHKASVDRPLALGPTHLDGDAQADLKNHGGPDKAVCCYSAEHYPAWRELLGLDADAFPYGAFGENFTLAGLPESDACIGDVFQIGTARVQISQPRMPCWKLGRRWERPAFPGEVKDSGKTGYYLRVLQPGLVTPGDPLTLLDRPQPDWPVARVNAIMYVHTQDAALAAEAARLPLLAEAWKSPFRRRVGLIATRKGRAEKHDWSEKKYVANKVSSRRLCNSLQHRLGSIRWPFPVAPHQQYGWRDATNRLGTSRTAPIV